MAKQIKVIKCPHCGNTKPTSLGNDHYRCEKCGTEFFLDNDDITINVNHSYRNNRGPNQKKIIRSLILGLAVFGFLIFILQLCTSTIKNVATDETGYNVSASESNLSFVDVQLIQIGNKPVAFYLESRNHYANQKEESGLFAVFYDFLAKEVISEMSISENYYSPIEHRYFHSNGKHYYIIDAREVWEIDSQKAKIHKITESLAQAKPALNSGFSTIRFVEEKNGDGLILTTNLGKAFYYFPTIDQLYTYSAYNHLASKGMETVSEDAVSRVYYLFVNRDSKESSNVAQLMQVTYKYNNGGPEERMTAITASSEKYKDLHRVTSIEPITENRICFFPEVLYADSSEVLITYRPTLADDAPYDIELLSLDGSTRWKVMYQGKFEFQSVVKTDSTYYIQANDDLVLEIKPKGQKKQYRLK